MCALDATVDSELLSRLQNGEVQAFDELYWKYHRAVYANIFKLVKDSEATKDICQEVFITLWEKRSSLTISQSVAGWLFVVSYNKAVSYLKKNSKVTITSIEKPLEMQPAEEPAFNVKEVQLQLLEAALGHLSPQRRRVFELCKLQGKTYEEAAQEIKISKHTVKEYLSAAVCSVKEYIQSHPDYPVLFFCPVLFALYLS